MSARLAKQAAADLAERYGHTIAVSDIEELVQSTDFEKLTGSVENYHRPRAGPRPI